MNQTSRWALRVGVKPGDAVALMMGNCPDYFAIWLGLTQIGAIVALINTNLEGAALAHCLNVADATRVIASGRFFAVLEQAAQHMNLRPEMWRDGEGDAAKKRFDLESAAEDGAPLGPQPVRLSDRALCIYTSGTTGLPKAANISHHRIVNWCAWFAGLCDMSPRDRMYNCLPMYHSVGGVAAIGAALFNGGSVFIREKFSASQFWGDVARWDCTMFQYIGELCRYLIAAPPSAAECSHRLRLALGNGMSGDVWRRFAERFSVSEIIEFYASTEGNIWLYNVEGKPGSIGKIPSFLAPRNPIALVRYDDAANAPMRGPDGFCSSCGPGETGEALGRISEEPSQRFEGYTQPAETKKKILRNVFAQGDAWMRSGDLMRRDAEGFFSFVDRIGDTFRWKGENVATLEVAALICACPGVDDAVVYGVAIPDNDGKAGMAMLSTSETFDLQLMETRLRDLPAYARPLFLRLKGSLATTSTHKHLRADMAAQGYDPAKVDGALYVFDRGLNHYVALDAARYGAIQSGAMRF